MTVQTSQRHTLRIFCDTAWMPVKAEAMLMIIIIFTLFPRH
jgi:hypothetical protein